MQTSKQTSRRRVSSRFSPLPFPTTDAPALSSAGQNALPKTPERPIVHTRSSASSGSSRGSIGAASPFSSNPSTPMTPESPITPPETTPNPSSPELIFSNGSTSRIFPSEFASRAAILEGDLEELPSVNNQPTGDTPLRNPAQRRRVSKSSPGAAKAAVSGSRPRLPRHLKLGSTLKQQVETKPRVPGAYESQNNNMGVECASDNDESLAAYPSVQISDNESKDASSSTAAEAAESVHDELDFETIFPTPKDTRAINTSIYKCIKSERKPPKNPRKPGWIYIFESPGNAPGHVKIGKTNSNPDGRRKDWEECGFVLLEVQDSHRSAFDHYSIVESLVMAELHNTRRKFRCIKHEKIHREWYEADRQIALNSIHRWRNWLISQRPLDETSNLTPYWRWRVEKLPKFINDVDWDRWTQPSPLDYLDYQLGQFGKGQYVQIKAHLSRKDIHFCLTGGMMIFILYARFGKVAAIWGLLALLVL